MAALGGVLIVVVILIVLFLFSSVKIVLEYERAVIFRLGRSVGAKGPGVFFVIPIIDKIRRVNLQIAAVPVAAVRIRDIASAIWRIACSPPEVASCACRARPSAVRALAAPCWPIDESSSRLAEV